MSSPRPNPSAARAVLFVDVDGTLVTGTSSAVFLAAAAAALCASLAAFCLARLVRPFLTMAMRRANGKDLEALKQHLEE